MLHDLQDLFLARHCKLTGIPPGFQNTTDAIGRAATEALQGTIQTAYKEAFQTIVLPVFDRGCQSMFQQINESFKQGTQECMFLHCYFKKDAMPLLSF